MSVDDRRVWVEISMILAWVQLAASTYIGIESSHNAISKIACLGGFFGFWVTVALIMMDSAGFVWVKLRQRTTATRQIKRQVTRFIMTRFLLHILFGLSFSYAVIVCTV